VGGEGGISSRVHLGEGEWRPAVGGERERRVLTVEGYDIKLIIIGRLDLLVSQPFLYICVGQYTIIMVEVTTKEYDYNISYIICL